ncbi:hypothetical protein MAR_007200, partial [Mya arenaria]
MPPAGYENKTTIEETDFNGIAAFIINCKRFRGKITGSICEKATEHIEQSATDGKRTIEIYVREEKRQATEHIEHFVTDGKRTLEDQTERLVKRLRKEEVEHLEQKKH